MTDDDSIALNCPEGYSGNISGVTVTNCKFNSWSLMRLYTSFGGSSPYSIHTVSVSNCSGTLAEAAFLIGVSNGSSPNSVASWTIADCNLTAPTILAVAENFGTIALQNVTFVPSTSHVVWNSSQTNRVCAFLRPSPYYGKVTCFGSSLSFSNCVIYRTSSANVAAVILEGDSMIDNLEFNRFEVQDARPYDSVQELFHIGWGSIGQLVLDSVDSDNISAPVAIGGFSSVGSVSGAGVLTTGWEFPDAVMANGVPYISASSGLPSIKIGGVVKPYP